VKRKVLLHIIATNKYDRYIQGVIESARNHFLKEEEVTFVVYTDSDWFLSINNSDVICLQIGHEPWPGPTLKRFHYFSLALGLINSSDFSFYIDVDSLFVRDITAQNLGIIDEFGGMIGTLHPGFYGKNGTPERRASSLAYISEETENSYFCGGFFGGSSESFAKAIIKLRDNIDSDLSRGIVAIWHDESHLNRYFLDNPPKSVLGLGFACPEERRFKDPHFMEPSIIFLDKESHIKIEKGQDVH
jgi:histo-blood group ABO system transferase